MQLIPLFATPFGTSLIFLLTYIMAVRGWGGTKRKNRKQTEAFCRGCSWGGAGSGRPVSCQGRPAPSRPGHSRIQPVHTSTARDPPSGYGGALPATPLVPLGKHIQEKAENGGQREEEGTKRNSKVREAEGGAPWCWSRLSPAACPCWSRFS